MAKQPRTKDEIQRQIDGLKKMKESLPEESMFGDKNWEKIDAQLDILEEKKTIDDFEYIDESSDEYEEGDNDIWFAAQDAEDWMDGSRTDDLFDEM